jgi:hypothetical protein
MNACQHSKRLFHASAFDMATYDAISCCLAHILFFTTALFSVTITICWVHEKKEDSISFAYPPLPRTLEPSTIYKKRGGQPRPPPTNVRAQVYIRIHTQHPHTNDESRAPPTINFASPASLHERRGGINITTIITDIFSFSAKAPSTSASGVVSALIALSAFLGGRLAPSLVALVLSR